MRSERARCWNASYPENSVTDRSRAVCRKWLCPGIERFGEHRDAVQKLCVDLLAFGADGRSARTSR
jgi:hypothetical protein